MEWQFRHYYDMRAITPTHSGYKERVPVVAAHKFC